MTGPNLSLVRSVLNWLFCVRGAMDGNYCLTWPLGFTHLALLPHREWTFHSSLHSTGIWRHNHPHSCMYNSLHPSQYPLRKGKRWKNEKRFLEYGAISKPQLWDFWESMQQETLCLMLGKMSRFEMAWQLPLVTLTSVFCPSQALFGSYSFLWKGHDTFHDLIQSLALPPASCVILGKLLDLIGSLFLHL